MKRLDISTIPLVAALAMPGCAPVGDTTPDAVFDWSSSTAPQCMEHYEDKGFETSLMDRFLSTDEEPLIYAPEFFSDGELESGDLVLRFGMLDENFEPISQEECDESLDGGIRTFTNTDLDEHYRDVELEICDGDYLYVLIPFEYPKGADYYNIHTSTFWRCAAHVYTDGDFVGTTMIMPDGSARKIYSE